MKSKLERSRQSARECRARKKLRYQYLDDLIMEREKANDVLRSEEDFQISRAISVFIGCFCTIKNACFWHFP